MEGGENTWITTTIEELGYITSQDLYQREPVGDPPATTLIKLSISVLVSLELGFFCIPQITAFRSSKVSTRDKSSVAE